MRPLLALLWLALVCTASLAQTPNKDGAVTPPRDTAPAGETKPRVRVLPGISITISPNIFSRPPPASAPSAQDPEAHEAGQLLVMWADDRAAREGVLQLQTRGLVPLETRALAELGVTLALYQFADTRAALRARDELRAVLPGAVVDLNARAYPQQGDGSNAAPPRLYALQMLGARPEATSDAIAAGTLAAIGVIDALIDVALLPGTTLHSVLGAGDTAAPAAHGTAIALLMASPLLANGFAGAAPGAPLSWVVAVRETGANARASSNSWLLAQALNWLLTRRVQLINISLGGAGDEVLRQVVQRVLNRSPGAPVAIVAAAGNQPAATPVYPAAYPGVWAVTAVDAAGQRYASASQGSFISFAAPGVDLWVPQLSGSVSPATTLFGRYVSGTSFAAALASATLARMPAAFWRLSAESRMGRLCAGARRVPPGGDAAHLGCGILQGEGTALLGAR
jgi:Subtilase family